MIDLASDTATKPCTAMREAMARAEVGDEQRDEDPEIIALKGHVAELLGQEDALFLPSGTMCNLIALAVHLRPGDEVICTKTSHIYGSEGAGAAVIAGASFAPIESKGPHPSLEELALALRPAKPRAPRSRLLSLEQTANRAGGAVMGLAEMRDVVGGAQGRGLRVHLDGARLLNAAVAQGVSAALWAGLCDSAWIDLSKGLGCPVGAVLAGPRDFIAEAWVWKHRLGGAMRQAGVLAAAGRYALAHNVARLAEDHRRARDLALLLQDLGFTLTFGLPQTNIVMFEIPPQLSDAAAFNAQCLKRGVRFSLEGPRQLRAVTHLDISDQDIARTGDILATLIASGQNAGP